MVKNVQNKEIFEIIKETEKQYKIYKELNDIISINKDDTFDENVHSWDNPLTLNIE